MVTDVSLPDTDASALAGLRILVTRPAHQADNLCALIEAAGGEAVRFPTLAIAPLADYASARQLAAEKQKILDLDHYQVVFFVSPNAARLAWEWIDQYWPQLPSGILWLAVGQSTADCLRRKQIPVAEADQYKMDSEALLQRPDLKDLKHQRVLICRGRGGRELMADTLRQRGARVDYVELYQRIKPRYDSQHIANIIYTAMPAAVLLSSENALQNFDSLCQQTKKDNNISPLQLKQRFDISLVLPSQRVADCASQLGYQRLILAENATDHAMLSALTEHTSQIRNP